MGGTTLILMAEPTMIRYTKLTGDLSVGPVDLRLNPS